MATPQIPLNPIMSETYQLFRDRGMVPWGLNIDGASYGPILLDADGALKVSGEFSATVTTDPAPTQSASLAGCATVGTGSGSVSAGALWVTFVLSSDFTGSIAGQTLAGATGASITFPSMGKKYPAIAYVVTTGTLTIFTAA